MGNGGSKVQYPIREDKPLNGIFQNLKILNDGSLKSVVNAKASSKSTRCIVEPLQVIEGPYDGEFITENSPDQWIQFQFVSKKADIHGYSLKTFSGAKNQTHMAGWKIEVSNDGYDWVVLDIVENSDELNESNKIITKKVTPLGAFSYIRISMVGKNHFGTNCLTLSNFEIFGNLA